MPLTMLNYGEAAAIKRIGGKEESKRFLKNLGFTVGEQVKIIRKRHRSGEGFQNCGKQRDCQ